MRSKIYRMVHIYEGNPASVIYKYFMITVIVLSLVPLTMKNETPFLNKLEIGCLVIFVIDYFLRWITADYKLNDKKWTCFLKFPFRLISIVDALSVLALFISVSGILISLEITEVFVVFRIVRIFRYSKNVQTILQIFKNSKKPLIAVGSLALGYIIISAIIIFNVEPDSFNTFFDAIYWSTVSLTTVGYGDIYPVTTTGRVVAMLSSFFGIAIVALPAGVVTAEYLGSIKKDNE